MKGTILKCLNEMVREQHGEERWREVLGQAGLSVDTFISPMQDLPEEQAHHLFGAASRVLGLGRTQLFDAFGQYWVSVYAPRVYPHYYADVHSSRDFLLKLDRIHVEVIRNMKQARPPRFAYAWRDERTLVMTYQSDRGLIDMMTALAGAVGKHFKEKVRVRKNSASELEIVFPN